MCCLRGVGLDAFVGFEVAGLWNVEVFQIKGQSPESAIVHNAARGQVNVGIRLGLAGRA